MPRSVNKWHGIGHLGRDAMQKFTTGQSVSTFTMACGRKWKDKQTGEWKEDTAWVPIVMWGNENVIQYLTKGKAIYVEGRISTRTYDKDGQKVYVTEIVADDVILLGGDGEKRGESPALASKPRPVAAQGQDVSDWDVPY
jgi:single-strand DNA-binding protein